MPSPVIEHNGTHLEPYSRQIFMWLCWLFKHMVTDIIRLYDGFITLRDTFPGGPPAYFGDIAQTTFVFKQAVYIVHTFVGDVVVVRLDFISNVYVLASTYIPLMISDLSVLRRLAKHLRGVITYDVDLRICRYVCLTSVVTHHSS